MNIKAASLISAGMALANLAGDPYKRQGDFMVDFPGEPTFQKPNKYHKKPGQFKMKKNIKNPYRWSKSKKLNPFGFQPVTKSEILKNK